MLLRLIEALCWLVAFLAAVAMAVLRALVDFVHELLILLLNILEACAKWCRRMYISIEVYARMFFVRVAWLLIQLMRLAIAFSPAIGAYLTHALFWPHPYLLWSAIGWTSLMMLVGIVLGSTSSARINVHAPTQREFSRMEYSFAADIFVSVFRCVPGVLVIVYSWMIPADTLTATLCLWGGITWMAIVGAVQVFCWLNRVEQKSAICFRARLFAENGMVHSQHGNYDQAIVYYTWAIELDAQCVTAFAFRGEAYRLKGCSDQAIADCTRAIELDPQNGFAFWNRGVAYRLKGNHAQAIADCTQAIELDPQQVCTFEERARAFEALGDADKAAQDRAEVQRLRTQIA